MKIKINDIEEALTILLKRLKEVEGNEIELNSEYYWDFSNDEIYNPAEDPKQFSIGQLSDDFIELLRLNKERDPIPYDLQRLSNILKAISIEIDVAW